ncbi:MAG: hypothetical protein MUE74_13745 [Bacteroidales bacterium]|jgi:hypothetical protein|nr:hypothetical protein [Bacteroidales bacterium]
MKKIISPVCITVLLLAFATAGCEKSDEELLVGTWNAISEHWIDYEDNVKVDEGTETYDAGELTIEIFENGTGKVHEDGEVSDFTWALDGSKLLITPEDDDQMTMGFSVSKDRLTITNTYEETYNDVDYKYVSETVFERA